MRTQWRFELKRERKVQPGDGRASRRSDKEGAWARKNVCQVKVIQPASGAAGLPVYCHPIFQNILIHTITTKAARLSEEGGQGAMERQKTDVRDCKNLENPAVYGIGNSCHCQRIIVT